MNRSSTPPGIRRLPLAFAGEGPPVISVTALAGLSGAVRELFGDKVLRQAKQAAMLDIEMIEDQECFIPQLSMTAFLEAIERRSGEEHFGLLVAPHVTLANYGWWGRYVLAAEDLGAAIARAVSTLGYHGTGDRLRVAREGELARLSYFSVERGRPGYLSVACGTAAAMISLFRAFLSPDWRPRWIELDVPRSWAACRFEETFSCPVGFNAGAVSVCFDGDLLDRPAMRRAEPDVITIEDVARARLGPERIDSLDGVVVGHIWAQVLAGEVSVDSTAQALGTSVRSLQRALHRDGVEFRDLVSMVRAARARELLKGTRASITDISIQLGYAAPANFARAFRKATGLAPQDFRKLVRADG